MRGGTQVLSPWCSVRVQKHQNGKEQVQSLVKPLVDCYFVHFKYLGCWCIGTVCEENDIETEPLYFGGCLIINRDVTDWLCCPLLGWTDCVRVVFTPLLSQWHYMWSKFM